MKKTHAPKLRLTALVVPTALALAACGGSDDSTPAAPQPPAASLSLSGTAATGAAISGGSVNAKCKDGSGSATSGADGNFKIDLAQGSLPCLLRVSSGATVLHSLANGSGASARANLTPLSELVLARLAGQNPAATYAAFDASTTLDAAKVTAAVDAVIAALKSGGVDLSGIDVLGGALVAANGATAGNAFDQKLDALKARLAESGTTLAELRDTMARESPAAPPSATSATPSLPSGLLLRAAATNCKALRSGSYRYVDFRHGPSSDLTGTVSFDPQTLRLTETSRGEFTQLSAAGECRYTFDSGEELVVSPAGVAVFRQLDGNVGHAGMLLPEQTHAVAALAGTWNAIGLSDTAGGGGPVHLHAGTMTVDATGRVTADVFCDDLKTCVNETPDALMAFAANSAGGFDFDGGRAFAYRSGSGELMVVALDRDGGMALATRKAPRALSPIDSVNRSWNLTLDNALTVPFVLGDSENKTVSHAGDGSSWTRNSIIDFANGITRPETVQINVPLEGFLRRVPGSVTASNGAPSNVSEWIGLPLRGMGITPVALPASQQLVLSVNKP